MWAFSNTRLKISATFLLIAGNSYKNATFLTLFSLVFRGFIYTHCFKKIYM